MDGATLRPPPDSESTGLVEGQSNFHESEMALLRSRRRPGKTIVENYLTCASVVRDGMTEFGGSAIRVAHYPGFGLQLPIRQAW